MLGRAVRRTAQRSADACDALQPVAALPSSRCALSPGLTPTHCPRYARRHVTCVKLYQGSLRQSGMVGILPNISGWFALRSAAGPLVGLRYLATTTQQPDSRLTSSKNSSGSSRQKGEPWRPLDGFNVTGMPRSPTPADDGSASGMSSTERARSHNASSCSCRARRRRQAHRIRCGAKVSACVV